MNPSYARIRCPLNEAIERFTSFVNPHEIAPPSEVSLGDAVEKSIDSEGRWLGDAKFVYENEGWTVFEDLSGQLGACGAEAWLEFAGDYEFVFAGYNDSIPYGELIIIRDRKVVRDFLHDEVTPEENVNIGTCADVDPLRSWIEVASFVDDDDLAFSETGLLWLHGPAR